jgi:hypothetical protein
MRDKKEEKILDREMRPKRIKPALKKKTVGKRSKPSQEINDGK